MGAKLTSFNEQTELTGYAGAAGTTIIIENLILQYTGEKKIFKVKERGA